MNNGKVRIYELSKELDLDNRDILVICEQLTIAVKSHSSTISDAEADGIRNAARNYVATVAPSPQKTAPSRKTPTDDARNDANLTNQKKQQILEIRRPAVRTVDDSDKPELSAPHPSPGGTAAQPAARSPEPTRTADAPRVVHASGGLCALRADGGGVLQSARAPRRVADPEWRRAGRAVLLHLAALCRGWSWSVEPRCAPKTRVDREGHDKRGMFFFRVFRACRVFRG